MNWTPSRDSYTTTIDGEFHLLGSDKTKAEQQFRFLLNSADLGKVVDKNPFFAQVADQWFDFVQKHHAPERYRLCNGRLDEFVEFKYKGIILAALNRAAKPKVRLTGSNPIKGLLELPEGDARGGDVVWDQMVYDPVLKMANTDLDSKALDVYLLLLRVSSDMLADLDGLLRRHGLLQRRMYTLALLMRHPDRTSTAAELATQVGVTKATMTPFIDGLERDRLVERVDDPTDRRKISIRLTAAGQKKLDGVPPDYSGTSSASSAT